MKKWFIACSMFIVLFVLAGCEPEYKIKDVEVVKKYADESSYSNTFYYVTVMKNGKKATFEIGRYDYKSLEKGTKINGNVYNRNYLAEIEYSELK